MVEFKESKFYKLLQDFFINNDKETFLQMLAEFYNMTEGINEKNDNQDELIKELRELYLEFNEKGIDENIVREKVNYFVENNAKIKDILAKLVINTNKIEDNTEKLNNIVNYQSVTPEQFNGTDYEKVQQCFDYAILNNRSIELNRMYDITSNTIMINKNPDPDRTPLYITSVNNGGIFKGVNGFIFNSTVPFVGDIFISNTVFKSEDGKGVTVFNGNMLLRVNSSKNKYFNVDCIAKSSNILQSFRFSQDNITGGNGVLLDSVNPYDIVVDNCLIENGGSFFKSTGTSNGCNSVRITNSCIENMKGFFFNCDRVENLVIQNNYLEKNLGGHIIFNNPSRQRNVNIMGNIHIGSAESGITSLIKWGSDVGSCISIGNRAVNLEVHDTSNITNGYIIALDGSGFNSIGTNKFINLQMSKNTINETNGTKTEWGFVTKLFNEQSVTINPNSIIKVTLPMIDTIGKEDSISIKCYHDDSTPILIKSYYSQNNNVVVWVKNEHTASISVTVRATVLQFKTF